MVVLLLVLVLFQFFLLLCGPSMLAPLLKTRILGHNALVLFQSGILYGPQMTFVCLIVCPIELEFL